jgi:uncharacterized damage-inducible protein DinB
VTAGLVDLFRHNTWANLRLIDVCSDLTPEQMAVSVDGTYGNIKDTLVHIVDAEEGYLRRLTGERRRDEMTEGSWPGFQELRDRAAESGAALEQVMTVLTQVGVQPPELDGWTYALETGKLSENLT